MHLWSQLSEIHPPRSVYQAGGRLKEEGFKNLQAEIWHLNTQKYKNLFSLVKIGKET